jgi:hypothetical protein
MSLGISSSVTTVITSKKSLSGNKKIAKMPSNLLYLAEKVAVALYLFSEWINVPPKRARKFFSRFTKKLHSNLP